MIVRAAFDTFWPIRLKNTSLIGHPAREGKAFVRGRNIWMCISDVVNIQPTVDFKTSIKVPVIRITFFLHSGGFNRFNCWSVTLTHLDLL